MDNNLTNGGSFIVLIKDFEVELFFLQNINLNTLTLKLIKTQPLLHQYRSLDISHLEVMTGCKPLLVYQTKCVGAKDKEAVMSMLIGLMAGLSTQFDDGAVNCEVGSTSYLIIDTNLHYTYISFFHKKAMLNAYGICVDPPKLNNLLEAAHFANAPSITPITEDYADQHGWTYSNCLEVVVSVDESDLMPIKREQWVLYKNSGWLREYVFTCYECATVTTERCDCWKDGLKSITEELCPRLGGPI